VSNNPKSKANSCAACLKDGGVYHPHQGKTLCPKCSAFYAIVDNLSELMIERVLDIAAEVVVFAKAQNVRPEVIRGILTGFTADLEYRSGVECLIQPVELDDPIPPSVPLVN